MSGYTFVSGTEPCADIDECAVSDHICAEVATCINGAAPGDPTSCECPSGYTGNGFSLISGGTACTDIDECASDDTNNCRNDLNKYCQNNDGSYDCVCQPADIYETVDYDGFIMCERWNECFEGTHTCDDVAHCTDVDSDDPRFLCTCPAGYNGDGFALASGGTGCTDIDECVTNNDNCRNDLNQFCENNEGGFDCVCQPADIYETVNESGFIMCERWNECFEGTHTCHDVAQCTDVDSDDPRFLCTCPSGYEGDGFTAASG